MGKVTPTNPQGRGANPGWRKNHQNDDIRDAMKAKGITQAMLAKMIDMQLSNTNRLLKRELPENIREALFETIKRYDPDKNPLGR